MTNCAGAIIRQSNRNINIDIKCQWVIKIENYHGNYKSIVTIYNSCKWDTN